MRGARVPQARSKLVYPAHRTNQRRMMTKIKILGHEYEPVDLEAELKTLQEENKALRDFVSHKTGCDKIEQNPSSHFRCTCGLDKLLKGEH